jgi:N-acyl-L-homoserine lactone synthetase
MTLTSTRSSRPTIRPARTAADVDAVLRGRHRVYCEDTDYLSPTADCRVFDRFDTYPDTTVHVLAEIDGCVVGGVRYCVHEPRVGLPVDEFFDFAPHVRPDDRLVCGGMMFVTRDAGRIGIATELIRSGESFAAERAASVVVGTVNPTITRLFGRLGYEPVGASDRHATGLPFVPVVKRLERVGLQ